ncbi:hypothetical protein HOC01_03880 [archaeon]|jgi:hypothetical protein|nr:hypothetical protein [archaeon]
MITKEQNKQQSIFWLGMAIVLASLGMYYNEKLAYIASGFIIATSAFRLYWLQKRLKD